MNIAYEQMFQDITFGWNSGNLEATWQWIHPEFKFFTPEYPAGADYETYKEWVTRVRTSFPDFHVQMNEWVYGESKIATYWRVTGTNTGTTSELPATMKSIDFGGNNLYYLQDDKIKKVYWYYDRFEFFKQLGLVEEPTPADILPA